MRALLATIAAFAAAVADAAPGVHPTSPRVSGACIDCHASRDRAVVHSWATSKHGVIEALGGGARTPDCVDCHVLDDGSMIRGDAMHPVCGKCHAPRYVSAQFESGARMVDIAQMKLREAEVLLARYRTRLTAKDRQEADRLYGVMQQHVRHVRLGVGHQSPDYQWWHGHPALDGDLLRIKGIVAAHQREAGASAR